MNEPSPGTDCLTDTERAFAASHRVARLATADARGAPHVIPICYACLGETFYFVVDEKPKSTRTQLKRLRNLRENPRVALVIDDYSDDWSRLAYLLVQGVAALVDDDGEYAAALAALRGRYPAYVAMDLRRATHPMVRITPQRCHTWSAGRSGRP